MWLSLLSATSPQVPFMYLPLYYMFEDTALGVGNPQSGLQRWWKELPGTMAAYCKIFPMRLDCFGVTLWWTNIAIENGHL